MGIVVLGIDLGKNSCSLISRLGWVGRGCLAASVAAEFPGEHCRRS
jgi:hypothetical protein